MKILRISQDQFEDEGYDSLEMPEREPFEQEQQLKEEFESKIAMILNLGMGELGDFHRFNIVESDPVNKEITIKFGE